MPQILVGMCRAKMKNGGLRSELECESGVSETDCRMRLAGTLAGR